MIAPTKHSLGQLGHLDLLALAAETGVAPSENQMTRFGTLSREALIDALSRTGPLAKLTEQAERRLLP